MTVTEATYVVGLASRAFHPQRHYFRYSPLLDAIIKSAIRASVKRNSHYFYSSSNEMLARGLEESLSLTVIVIIFVAAIFTSILLCICSISLRCHSLPLSGR